MGSQGEEGGLFVSPGRSPLPDRESCKYGDDRGTFAASCIVSAPRWLRLRSGRGLSPSGRRSAALRPALANPRAQVGAAGPRPALSAGPTPPRPPGSSPGAGPERVRAPRRPGRQPPERRGAKSGRSRSGRRRGAGAGGAGSGSRGGAAEEPPPPREEEQELPGRIGVGIRRPRPRRRDWGPGRGGGGWLRLLFRLLGAGTL